MQTKTQPTQPLEFITVVNNTSCTNSTSNDNDIHFEEEEDHSMTMDDLFRLGDASDDGQLFSSSDDLMSFDSAEISHSSLTSEDDEDPLDFLNSYPAYLTEATNPANSKAYNNKSPQLGKLERVKPDSLGYPHVLYPDCASSGSVTESSDRNAGRNNKYSKDSIWISSVRSRLYSDCSTATMTMPTNSMPSDLTSASYSVVESSLPSAVTFAEECLKRSNSRRFLGSSNNVFTLPESLLCDKNDEAPIASEVSFEASTMTSTTDSPENSTGSSSSVSRLTSSVISSSTALSKLSALVLENEAFIEDYDQSACAGRVSTIKRQLRTMEIQHYRTKCVRSLRRSMVRYKKISEDDDSSLVSSPDTDEPLPPAISEDDETKPMRKGFSQSALEVARDILCFNIILAILYMFFILYKDTITEAMQGAGVSHLFTVSV